MNKQHTNALYLLMLLLHVAHVFEEVWGRFWIIRAVHGLGWFLTINWALICIPVISFYFYLQNKSWAVMLSLVYAAVMTINGFVHILATLVTGKYFDGYAGANTGAGLVLVGGLLFYKLSQEIKIYRGTTAMRVD